ncbi:MAG TPA: hypothetical protein GX708_18845 [Gallicola sp.]|nr:hypothetical protein [Gallicola sp.]
MGKEITKDYMYLIVKCGNRLKTIEEKIEYNYEVESMMNDFIRYKKRKLTQTEISEFISKVQSYYPDFFKNKSYAIRYNSSYVELGLPSGISVDEFKEEVYNYIYANALESLYSRYERDSSVIAYSHRKRGWKTFSWKLDNTFKFLVSTNFAYGNSSYFLMVLYWKELPIINYLHIIFYRFAQYYDIAKVTESYKLIPEEWKTCFDNTVYYVNTYYNSGHNDFVKRYLDNTFIQLINGLEINLNTNLFCVLSEHDVNELFIRKNYFSDIYLYSDIGPNILVKKNSKKIEEVSSVYESDSKIKDILKKQNLVCKSDVDYVLGKLIPNYENQIRLQQKAKIYMLMLDLYNILKLDPDNNVISSIFNWLYENLKAYNNYNDEKVLYLIEDDFELQIKRSEQCALTIKALNNTKDNEMNYIYNLHKNKLVHLINILKNQNELLISKLKEEIEKLEEEIAIKTIKKNDEFKILEQKQSYKNNFIYNEYFTILNDCLKNLITYKESGFVLQTEINEKIFGRLKELKIKMQEFNFDSDNLVNLLDFGLENKIYYIYYENYRCFSFDKGNIVKKYVTNKNDTEKNVLCSIVSIPKNIHQIMKNLFLNLHHSNIYKMLNTKSTEDIFKDILVLAKYCNIDKLTEEQYTRAFKSVIDIYVNSFQLNSYGYIENTEIYNVEAKPYNDLVNEISKLTSELKAIQNKVSKLEEYKKLEL